jgi:membrane protein DedA with SNARE-associated domain
MDNALAVLGDLVAQYPSWTKVILGGAMLLQGEVAILFAVYLAVAETISWSDYFLATLSGLIVGETFVYILGRFLRHTRFGWKWYHNHKESRKLQLYTYYLKQNLIKLFIITKFIPGTNFVVLTLTGWSRTGFFRFLRSYLTSVLVWFSSMTALAYGVNSGLEYLRGEHIFKQVEYGIGGLVILVFLGEYLLRKFVGKEIFKIVPGKFDSEREKEAEEKLNELE